MKRKLLAGVCVVMFGISGMAYSDDTTVTLDGNTSSSGFSVKDSSGASIARFGGDGNVGIGTTGPGQKLEVAGYVMSNTGDAVTGGYYLGNTGHGLRRLTGTNNVELFTLTGNLYFSANAAGGNQVVIQQSGNVGIGTTSPDATLTVSGMYRGTGLVRTEGESGTIVGSGVGCEIGASGGSFAFLQGFDRTASYYAPLHIYGSYVNFAGGNVGIGTTAPSYTLHVVGTAYCTSGSWSGSDERWKKEITPLENSLSNVLKLQGVSYLWKTDEYPNNGFTKGRQVGLIAQEVEKIIPELVHTDNEGYKSVSYEKLTAVLIEAVKEQQKQIEELKEMMNKAIQLASVK